MQQAEEKAREREKLLMSSGAAAGQKGKTGGKEASHKPKDEFIPKPGSIQLQYNHTLKA